MSDEILSQDEIDALLTGVDSGDVDTDAEAEQHAAPNTAMAYDFTSQDRIVRGRLPTLDMINERFARNFRISLFNFLRRSPTITVEGVQTNKFGDYIHSLFMPSNLNLIKIKPLRGTALFVLNPTLVYSLVDNYFGGSGKFHTKIEGREFTGTEMQVVKTVMSKLFDDLKKAWAPIMALDFEHVGSEVNPQFANIVSPSEVVVISTFHVELDNGGGDIHMTLPYSMLEPIREQLHAGVQSDTAEKDDRWGQSLRDRLKKAPLLLKSRLTDIEMTLRDLKKMQVGDVIPFDFPETVVATVEDIPVFKAGYGMSRGNHALKVTELLNQNITKAKASRG